MDWVGAFANKGSHGTSQVFLQQVLSQFGAYVEVLIDQGIKFCGKFLDLIDYMLIDHCQTLRDHPQVDKLAKQMMWQSNKGFVNCITQLTQWIGT